MNVFKCCLIYFIIIKVKENVTCKIQTDWTCKFLAVFKTESNQDTKHKQQILTWGEQRWWNKGQRHITRGCSHVDFLRFVLNIFFNRTPSLDPVLLFTVTLNKFKTSNVSWGCYARGPSALGGNDEMHRCLFHFSSQKSSYKHTHAHTHPHTNTQGTEL